MRSPKLYYSAKMMDPKYHTSRGLVLFYFDLNKTKNANKCWLMKYTNFTFKWFTKFQARIYFLKNQKEKRMSKRGNCLMYGKTKY